MIGTWDLLLQYRRLVKGRKSDVLNHNQVGIMRSVDPTNPEGTKIAALSRRRVMDLLNKKSMQPKLISTVDHEARVDNQQFVLQILIQIFVQIIVQICIPIFV